MALDDILKQIPIDDIASKLGVTPEVAKTAVEEGGTVLLGGLAKNAETPAGSAAIENALKKHEGATLPTSVDDIDQVDGGKIVTKILGPSESEVAQKLTESNKTAGVDFGKLLPMLAPIVMGLLANKNKAQQSAPAADEPQSGGGIGDLIGGLVGGGSGGAGGLGGMLGGLLGGGSGGTGGGGLGSILGGLLGGKK